MQLRVPGSDPFQLQQLRLFGSELTERSISLFYSLSPSFIRLPPFQMRKLNLIFKKKQTFYSYIVKYSNILKHATVLKDTLCGTAIYLMTLVQ